MAAPASGNSFAQSYNSISGIDIKAVFDSRVAVALQACSYAIQREKAPIYTMGFANPRAFSRGKRGIAGTLIFAQFDAHPLVAPNNQGLFTDGNHRFFADEEELVPSMSESQAGVTGLATAGTPTVINPTGLLGDEGSTFNDQVLSDPWYVDQIPPFNITLVGSNEYGTVTTMSIIGVELVNEGYGISIDDLMSEHQYTFVAREIAPWTRLPNNDAAGGPTTATVGV